MSANSQPDPVQHSSRIGQAQARAAHAAGADTTHALAGGGARSSPTTTVEDENPAPSNRGPRADNSVRVACGRVSFRFRV